MKLLAFAFGLLTVTLVASSAARADDFAVVQFNDRHCQIWWDSAGDPWGAGWTKIAFGLPDHMAAQAALDNAIVQGVCR